MKAPLLLAVVLLFSGMNSVRGQLTLRIERSANRVFLVFDTHASTNYQVQTSTDLKTWQDHQAPVVGDGSTKTQEVTRADLPLAVFRLSATAVSESIAPREEAFAAAIVGKNLLGYRLASETRFSWFGEEGNWTYTQVDHVTGKLVFTYDEDGNNPAVYREEALMTFETPTTGSFRYSEINGGKENPASVVNGPFDLNSP
ncbi:MAG: hypothetical protein AB9869_32105 [Verrucomicrobiia bacterium]